jgi:DNA polymerase-3 subunit alpha
MDNIPMFGRRKNGEETIEYPHALLEGILSETYGIFVYQEQVMQAAQILAGYSLGGADLLRRAMGKKIQSEMDEQRANFRKGVQSITRSSRQRRTSCST